MRPFVPGAISQVAFLHLTNRNRRANGRTQWLAPAVPAQAYCLAMATLNRSSAEIR